MNDHQPHEAREVVLPLVEYDELPLTRMPQEVKETYNERRKVAVEALILILVDIGFFLHSLRLVKLPTIFCDSTT